MLSWFNKAENAVLKDWGRRKPQTQNLYYEQLLLSSKSYDQPIDESTKEDLDLDLLFNLVDRTTSIIGQQCLYERLMVPPCTNEVIQNIEDSISFYDRHDFLEIIKSLAQISKEKDYIIPSVIYDDIPAIELGKNTIRAFQLTGFALLLFGINFHLLWIGLVPLMGINLFLHYRLKNQIGIFTTVFSRLKVIHNTIKGTVKYSHFTEDEKAKILFENKQLKSILKRVNISSLDQLQDREATTPLWYVAEIFKSITLIDVAVYNGLLRNIDTIRKSVEILYYALGDIEIALSVLALRRNTDIHCIPNFQSTYQYKTKGMYHPLLIDAVPNDVEIKKSGILVTGSNMSGKSTFIKMLSLNTICAQALNTCFAKEYASPIRRVASSMNTSDEIETGASYYLQEVDRIGLLMEYSQTQSIPYILTIDEVFRGTNTIERIGAAKSVLTYMIKQNALVIVSTHDIELADLLRENYELYYFQEKVSTDDLSFDYKLKTGVMTERNAIKILKLAGYPEEVVEDAEATSKLLAERV